MRRTAVLVAGWSVCAVLAAAAVQTPPPQTPVFRAGVDLVQLDVSVLDKNRQPVRGLTQADFTILEDGKPQTIEAFAAVDLPDPPVPTAPWMREIGSDVASNVVNEQRLFLMVLDDGAMSPPSPTSPPLDRWALRAVKTAATSFVDRLGPSDLAAVVFTGFLPKTHAQGLTSDHAKLKAAIATFDPDRAHGDTCTTVNALLGFTETLRDAGLPERRKALVIFSSAAAPPHMCAVSMVDVFRVCQMANINLYPIDACGLRPVSLAANSSLRCNSPLVVENMRIAANNTGGKAIVSTNDFEPGLTQIFAENKSYYLLGYRPANVNADGTFRRLEVKVDRPGVEVRTRSQYVAPKTPDAKKALAPPPAGVSAMANILPKADVPLRMALAPFAMPGTHDAAVVVTLGVREPVVSARTTEEATLTVRAFTADGAPRGSADQQVTLTLMPARRGDEFSRYDLLAAMPLKPDKYELRVSAHSGMLDKLGSVYADVEVPDFAKDPLSLSGVLISVTPGVPAAPSEALGAIVPVLPTTERAFARTDRVSAFLRVYQGGGGKIAPVSVSIRIVDAHDQTAFGQTDALDADAFGKVRAYDERFALPLNRLAPGEYLLTFEATMDKTKARRDVRFSVR